MTLLERTVRWRPFLFVLGFALAMASGSSFADRAAYSEARDIVARSATLVARHRHDWFRVPVTENGWRMDYSPETPFGVPEDVSNVELHSAQGELIAGVPSPPLTYLEVSPDSKYVIGLSEIKHVNATQLVVYGATGELLLRRGISAEVFCFDVRGYEELKQKHFALLQQLAKYSRESYRTYGWKEGDKVYLDIKFKLAAPGWDALWSDLHQMRCKSPLSANFGESVTNWVHWYHRTHPKPRVTEKGGRPFEVRLRDPKGLEFAVKFELTALE